MKAVIDPELCVGCGDCEEICPEVFQLVNDVAEIQADSVPPASEDACREAINACPVDALCLDV